MMLQQCQQCHPPCSNRTLKYAHTRGFLWPQLWKMVRSAATDEANAMAFLLLMGKFVKQMGYLGLFVNWVICFTTSFIFHISNTISATTSFFFFFFFSLGFQ